MNVLHGFEAIHAIIFVVLAVFHIRVWIRRGFWLPRYVHVLAGMAFLLGAGTLWFIQQPQFQQNSASKPSSSAYWLALIFPAIVYVAFVLYGGVLAAPEKKEKTSEPTGFNL